jgi:hypothetical protein
MSVSVQLPDGQKTHYVQEPGGVRNLHIKVPHGYLFYDDLTAYTGANIVSQSASHVGSWRAVSTRKGSVHHALYHGVDYIHSDATGAYATSIEAIPGYGLSFDQNKLRIKFEYYLKDGTPAVHKQGSKNAYLNSVSVNCYCESGLPDSGIQLIADNPTLAHTLAELGHRLRIISHNRSYVPNVEYTTSDTKLLSNGHLNVELIVERLPGNLVEVNASFDNYHGGANLLKVNSLQFAVDDNIYKQNVIIFEMRNGGQSDDARIWAPIAIDNPDYV